MSLIKMFNILIWIKSKTISLVFIYRLSAESYVHILNDHLNKKC